MKNKLYILIVLCFCLVSLNVSNEVTSLNTKTNELTIDTEFRAVWITAVAGDIGSYYNEVSFKSEMNTVFNVMEHFKLNAMIYHIRTHNNALYKSELNPVAGWWKDVDFDKFDPLEWLIDECHKRGYEFHAWMNPYRLGNSHYYGSALPSVNPANDNENTLGSILNPGLPNVRQFLIDTVMEVIENYDVDAIHFDDYFYIGLGANGALTGSMTILDESDQPTFLKYPGDYNTSSAYDKADWRRDQVSLFVKGLSENIDNYNSLNNKHVQLGISPTGIYKNGDGVVTYDSLGKPITTGSKTSGQTHYSSYLFADSVKWISEGWLDYILPQSYWATDHNVASYYDVMGWWDKVVKNLDVNLYSGIGIYQADQADRFSWTTDATDLFKQLTYVDTLDNVNGVCFYSYQYLLKAYKNGTSMSSKQLECIGDTIWLENKLLSEIKSMEPINLGEVSNFTSKKNVLKWNNLAGAKFYVIYKDSTKINYTNEQILAVIGSEDELITYIDSDRGNYVYGIKAMSYTNTLGEGSLPTVLTPDPVYNIGFYADNVLVAQYESDLVFDLPKIPFKFGYDKVTPTWSITDFSNITADLRVDANYTINKYTVEFFDKEGKLAGTEFVEHGAAAIGITLAEVEGYVYSWDQDITNVQSDLEVHPQYDVIMFTVKFLGLDGLLFEEVQVEYGKDAIAPLDIEVSGYEFVQWDKDFTNIREDLEVTAEYKEIEEDKDKDNEESIFSCLKFNYNFIIFTLGFALFVFIKRKK